MTNCTILVGAEEREYVIDIEQLEVFKSMLQRGFPEHKEGIIRLPEELPNDFDFFIEFLTTGKNDFIGGEEPTNRILGDVSAAHHWSWYPGSGEQASDSTSSQAAQQASSSIDGKELLEDLSRLYIMADRYKLEDWRAFLVHHMFGPQGVVSFCPSRELFDFLAKFLSQPMSPPPKNFNVQIRRCIENYFIASGRFDPLLPGLIKKGGPVAELIFLTVRDLYRDQFQSWT